jgi:hypothetical protein
MGQVGITGITAINTADPYQRLSVALIISAVTASQQGDPEAQCWLESCALRWLWLIVPREADANSILAELLATVGRSNVQC